MRAFTMPIAEPVDEVVLTFHAGTPAQRSIRLAKIVDHMKGYAPVARGANSRVWRFIPTKGGAPYQGETSFALKCCHIEPATGRRCSPHEYGYLSRLSSPLFPRAIGHGVMANGDYVLVSEWIDGRNLARHILEILTELLERNTYEMFCSDLLEILRLLTAAGIEHSDIWEPNIIVRQGRPVLIDFGWAHAPGEPPLIPTLHQPDDTIAMNQLLKRLAALYNQLLLESEIEKLASGART